MQQKFNVLIARMSYGWQENPDVTDWIVRSILKAKDDPRIGRCVTKAFDNTPTTLARHEAVMHARRPDLDADLLWMIDADMHPDHCPAEPGAVDTWSAFMEFAYEHYQRGPFVIAAPYCGRSRSAYGISENVYVFRWRGTETGSPHQRFELAQFNREEAAERGGIERVAALPTGLVLYDMRCFGDLPGPQYRKRWAPGGPNLPIPGRSWQPQEPPWFYYQYDDPYEAWKIGTEDACNTRDLSALGVPQYIHWGAWAGHYKQKCVSKPVIVTSDYANDRLLRAALMGRASNERLVMIGDDDGSPPRARAEEGGEAPGPGGRPGQADDRPEVPYPPHRGADRGDLRPMGGGGEGGLAPEGVCQVPAQGADRAEHQGGQPPAGEAHPVPDRPAEAGQPAAAGGDGGPEPAE
ncbi:MAG TPA: hypothetical protein VM243_11955 [Phycisphaerae bacterium]|nr:hypothetical protein [Phycisphaerae bacterium]